MKRLVIFGCIFGAGLIVLIFLLGPSRLWREVAATSILPEDLSGSRPPLIVSDPAQNRLPFAVGLQGAGQLPIWRSIEQPDGSSLRVKDALLRYQGIEAFAGGVHFTAPVLEFFPGRARDEPPSARIRAAAGDLATRAALHELTQGLAPQDVRQFVLAGGAVFELLDATGAVDLTLETERFESPEAVPAADGTVTPMAVVRAPGPVHLHKQDGSLDLRAGGMELDRTTGRLLLAPPIALHGTELELPGLTAGAPATAVPAKKAAADPKAPPEPPPPPFELRCDGPATYVRAEEPAAATGPVVVPETDAPAAPAPTFDPGGLARVFGPGTLTFTRNVVIEQAGRSLRGDRVVLTLVRDAAGALKIDRCDAEESGSRVTLGLFGGSGSARAAHFTAATGSATLDGPLELKDLVLGEGTSRRTVTLRAEGRLIASELAPQPHERRRMKLELFDRARVVVPDDLDATAQQIVAELSEPAGTAGPAGDAAAAPLGLAQLTLDGDVDADLAGRGHAWAAHIDLTEEEPGRRIARLRGAARVEMAQGFITGEEIDATVPADPAAPLLLRVPQVVSGELEIPGGAAIFGEPPPAEPAAAPAAVPPRRILIEPLAPCRLEGDSTRVELRGRCVYRVRAGTTELQRLECDQLDLITKPAAPPHVRAEGAVVLTDPENGVTIHAEQAWTEEREGGVRVLLLRGSPAHVELIAAPGATVVTRAARMELELATRRLVADDEANRCVLLIPESLLARALPALPESSAPPGAAAAVEAPAETSSPPPVSPVPSVPPAPPLELRAEHLVLAPGPRAAETAALVATDRVTLMRPSDGATVAGRRLEIDLARQFARIDGTADALAEIARPMPYAAVDPAAADRIQRVRAEWVECRDGGATVVVAPKATFVLHPEQAWLPGEPTPKLVRVELTAADAARLQGTRLLMSGGVETDLTTATDHAHARSERLELLFDRPLNERGATPVPVRMNAQQRVRLDHQGQVCEGALLSYEFATGWLELKEGSERCSFVGQDATGAWHATAHFERMRIHLPTTESPLQQTEIKRLELAVEARGGR